MGPSKGAISLHLVRNSARTLCGPVAGPSQPTRRPGPTGLEDRCSTCRTQWTRQFQASARIEATSQSQTLAFPAHLSNPSPYDIFQLPRSSSAAEIKSRYYDLVKCLHPDRRVINLRYEGDRANSNDAVSSGRKARSNAKRAGSGAAAAAGGDMERAKEEFRLVVKAYELLSDRRRRAAFDKFGIGWDGADSAASGRPNWPAPSEHEWAELRRRGAFAGWNSQRGHDAHGWQRYAGDSSSNFYAGSAGPRSGSDFSFDANFAPPGSGGTRYASNQRFISVVAILTWGLALWQFHRLSLQSEQAVTQADRRHLDAVKNLDEARRAARSTEGRQRLEALRRKVREERVVQEIEGSRVGAAGVALIEAPVPASSGTEESRWGIGHGGPSGMAEHERKRRQQQPER